MHWFKNTFIFFLLLSTLFSIEGQTSQQIQQKLKQEGISTKTDVDEELKKRNMTEDDARRLAKQYGMDYDSFIATYILGGGELPTTSVVTDKTPDNVTNVIVSSREQTPHQLRLRLKKLKLIDPLPRLKAD